MDSTPPLPLSDSEIHALLDEQGPSATLAALRVRLAQDPAAQAILLKWQQQRLALKQLYQDVSDEPIPVTLMNTVNSAALQAAQPWSRWGAMAAAVLLSFGVGWLSHTAWQNERPAAFASARPNVDFARQASVAHVVFSPELRHPVEVGAAEQDHLVQWLSKRLGKPLKVPKLSAQGFELVGGRLLPGETGARAQFMFQNADGLRITLYLGAVDALAGNTETRETAFSYLADGATSSFYWVDQGFGYALTGHLPRDALLTLAEAIYRQL